MIKMLFLFLLLFVLYKYKIDFRLVLWHVPAARARDASIEYKGRDAPTAPCLVVWDINNKGRGVRGVARAHGEGRCLLLVEGHRLRVVRAWAGVLVERSCEGDVRLDCVVNNTLDNAVIPDRG